MSEMERQIARAILDVLRKSAAWVQDNPTTLTAVDVDGVCDLEAMARAAIEAMKESTP